MTEAEWLASSDPAKMLEFLQAVKLPQDYRNHATARKLRLFAVACCRQVWDGAPCDFCKGKGHFQTSGSYSECPRCLGPNGIGTGRVGGLTDPRSRRAVEVAERFADGEASEQELLSARSDTLGIKRDWIVFYTCSIPNPNLRSLTTATPYPGTTQEDAGPFPETAVMAALLRCMAGNPWRPVKAEPMWLLANNFTVANLARTIYAERAFDRLPILGDALEDAGCTDEAILRHCRGYSPCYYCFENPAIDRAANEWCTYCGYERWLPPSFVAPLHARGCWVIDLLLGKG